VAAERAVGNGFGLAEAAIGLAAGFILANVLASAYLALAHRTNHTGSYGEDLCSLVGLWIGFLGSALFASKGGRHGPRGGVAGGPESVPTDQATGQVRQWATGRWSVDYGLKIKPLVDIPLGLVVGVVSQFALVPLLELPLVPFVHNLSQQIGKPAEQLTGNVFGAGFVVLAVFVCVGSPFVEEVFFRGLLLRALLGWFTRAFATRSSHPAAADGGPEQRPATARQGNALAVTVSILISSLLFAFVHFEAIQFLGLAGFGAVLALLAWRTGRLGPGLVAHAAFNAVAIIAIARSR
jgi:membrane protease YdiL (CAAX protease family)